VPPSPTQDVSLPGEQPTQDTGNIIPTTEPTPDVFAPQDVPTQETVQQQPIADNFLTATAIVAQATNLFLTPSPDPFQTQITVPTFTPTTDPFAVASPTSAPLPGVDCVHEVRSGENLFRLSLLYGVTVNEIAAASGITNIDLLAIGQRLTIPGCGTTGAFPPATSAPTQGSGVGATPDTGGPINPTPIPSAGGVTHIVQQGETLFEISLQYGVPVNTIAAANGISNINLIYINQELTIP
jgi:LysM repeat protein